MIAFLFLNVTREMKPVTYLSLRAVGFSYAKQERNHCEQARVRRAPRDAFDVNFICQF